MQRRIDLATAFALVRDRTSMSTWLLALPNRVSGAVQRRTFTVCRCAAAATASALASTSPPASSTPVSSLPLPPRRAPSDGGYSCTSSHADSAFSSVSLAPLAEAHAPPPPMLMPLRNKRRSVAAPTATSSRTWCAASSSQLGDAGRIMVYASEVSTLVGLNTFRPLYEAFEKVWARTEPELYRHRIAQAEAILGYRLLTRDEEAELVLASPAGGEVSQRLASVLARVQEFAQDDLEREKKALKRLASSIPSLTSTQVAQLSDYLVGQVSKAYGVLNEDRALRAYEHIAGVEVLDNNKLFYGRQIGECVLDHDDTTTPPSEHLPSSDASSSQRPSASSDSSIASASLFLNDPVPRRLRRAFWVGGRVDGFSSATGDLIEMKNRTRRFLTPLPAYDRCQMEVYLQVCEVDQGELVERLRKKVDRKEAASEQARLQAIERERQRRREEEREMEQAQRIATIDPDEEDAAFLTAPMAAPASSEATSTALASAASASESSLPAADEDVDVEFLAETRPLVHTPEEEEDASFLAASSSFIESHSLSSNSEAPAFEIFGTQVVKASDLRVGGARVTNRQSITHILIREPPSSMEASEHDAPATVDDHAALMDSAFLTDLVESFVAAATPEIVDDNGASDDETAASPSTGSTLVTSPPTASTSDPEPTLYIDQIKRTVVHSDARLWSREILPALENFAHFLTRFLADPERQLAYLQCKTEEEKHAMLAAIVPATSSSSPSTPEQYRAAYAKKKRAAERAKAAHEEHLQRLHEHSEATSRA